MYKLVARTNIIKWCCTWSGKAKMKTLNSLQFGEELYPRNVFARLTIPYPIKLIKKVQKASF